MKARARAKEASTTTTSTSSTPPKPKDGLNGATGEIAIKTIQIIFLASFLVYIGLYIFYGFTLATVPNKAIGAIFPLNLHGHIVYLDRSPHQWLRAFGSLAFFFGAIFASIGAIMLYRHGTGYRFRDQGSRRKSL